VIPIDVAADGTPWRSVVAAEQMRPIPPTPGSLVRVVLVPRESGCAVVLTFAHQFVRILSPVDLRRAVGLPDEVVVRFAGARTGSAASAAKDFWTLARHTRASLTLTARAPAHWNPAQTKRSGRAPSSRPRSYVVADLMS